jgi:BirA family biotin operon repressor/biotin-[acetyl-CoA-carboxylase] ligase
MSPAETAIRLDAGRLQAACANQVIGNRIVVLETAGSTNDVVAEMAAANREGMVVLAETQTAARGQYGRRWESAEHKGLWVSILLRPKITPRESRRLTEFLAQVVATTIEEEAGLVCTIKSPNDVFLEGKKIAGVLVELRVEAGGRYVAIAGIGLNVNQTREDFPPELRGTAGSIALAVGSPTDRNCVAIALLQNLNKRYPAMFGGAVA